MGAFEDEVSSNLERATTNLQVARELVAGQFLGARDQFIVKVNRGSRTGTWHVLVGIERSISKIRDEQRKIIEKA